MAVVNGQIANQTTFNNAFMSRTAATTQTVAKVALENADAGDSGAIITNAQKAINKAFEGVGSTGESDTTINAYSSNEYITNGDNRKVAIGKLDAQLKLTQDDLDDAEGIIVDHESRLDVVEPIVDQLVLDVDDHETRVGNIEARGGGKFTTFANELISGGGLVTKSNTLAFQYRRISGNGGAVTLSATPFGDSSLTVDGTVIRLRCTSDTDTVSVNQSDVQWGAMLNGNKILDLYDELTLQYDSILERWFEIGSSSI